MKLFTYILIFAYALTQVWVQAQNCPAIKYSQNVHTVESTALRGSPAFAISFTNNSPYLPLSFLDVHYRLNDGMVHNFRILSSENTDKPVLRQLQPFLMQPEDSVTYNFTYQVAGLDFACNTPTFRVNAAPLLSMIGKTPVMKSNEQSENRQQEERGTGIGASSTRPTAESSSSVGVSESRPMGRPVQTATAAPRPGSYRREEEQEEATMPASRTMTPAASQNVQSIQRPTRTQVVEPVRRSTPVTSMSPRRPTSGPLIQPVEGPYGMFPEDQEQDVGKMPTATDGACPLINYKQKILRSAGTSKYLISFHNLSPDENLAFLDVHYKISDFPVRNVRIFSNPEFGSKANEGAVTGLQLTPDDVMRYSFTYGVGKRACDTEVYTVHANEIEED